MADKKEVTEERGLASSREQRKNAGNKMSKLLADELDEDDFYKTALGGFEEESGDEEYASEAEMSDHVDSDFSFSETDEVIEQDIEEDGKRKRKKTLYKEPKRTKITEKGETSQTKQSSKAKAARVTEQELSLSERRKSTRALTIVNSELHRKKMAKKRKGSKKHVKLTQKLRPLTQEELLAEAKITEEENIESLRAYQLMEKTKKQTKNMKIVKKGPMIRYLSVTMPVVEDEIDIEDDQGVNKDKTRIIEGSKCSRNFIIFTDAKTFPGDHFQKKKLTLPQKSYCPATGLPAKYMDPVTKMPYATSQAFRYIRQHYAKQETEREGQEKRTRSTRKSSQTTTATN